MDVELEEILRSAGLEWESCTPIPGGLQHDLYRVGRSDGGHTVLKVGKSDSDFGDAWERHRTHWEGLRRDDVKFEPGQTAGGGGLCGRDPGPLVGHGPGPADVRVGQSPSSSPWCGRCRSRA